MKIKKNKKKQEDEINEEDLEQIFEDFQDNMKMEEEEEEDLQENDSQLEKLNEEEEKRELQLYKKLKGKIQTKEDVIDKDGIEEKLKELQLKLPDGKIPPWIETLTLTTKLETILENLNDDLERETAFVNQTLEAAKLGITKLEELGVPIHRPDDYFAEMVKSDEHMLKIKSHLMEEKRRIENIQEKKKQRDTQKYGKAVQQIQQQKKEQEKKQALESITRWRKAREKGKADGDEIPLQLTSQEKKEKLAQANKKKKFQPNPKRQAKNAKYGYGGRKKFSKTNTSQSTNTLKGFNMKKNKSVPTDLKKLLPKKKISKGKRPGNKQRKKKN